MRLFLARILVIGFGFFMALSSILVTDLCFTCGNRKLREALEQGTAVKCLDIFMKEW